MSQIYLFLWEKFTKKREIFILKSPKIEKKFLQYEWVLMILYFHILNINFAKYTYGWWPLEQGRNTWVRHVRDYI
jgi:hypothetical protein